MELIKNDNREIPIQTYYYGQCEHAYLNGDIENGDCLKRYFTINTLDRFTTYRIAVCNDYLKLLIQEARYRKYIHLSNPHFYSVLEDIVIHVINEHGLQTDWIEDAFVQHSSPMNRYHFSVGYLICERPHIYGHVDLYKAINLLDSCSYFEAGNRKFIEQFRKCTFLQIINVLEHALKYNKYKKYKVKVEKFINDIHYGKIHNMELELIELISEILTKMKKQ